MSAHSSDCACAVNASHACSCGAVRERPILFSAPMVRAILDGRKTMTRRVVDRDLWDCLDDGVPSDQQIIETDDTPMGGVQATRFCPYGYSSDMLWVRETFMCAEEEGHGCGVRRLFYMADEPGCDPHGGHPWCGPDMKWGVHPSIHMPRWASRITLEVTSVKVERVQDITEADAIAEGVAQYDCAGGRYYCMAERAGALTLRAKYAFHALWDSINESRGCGWSVNPWVWCVSFRRAK